MLKNTSIPPDSLKKTVESNHKKYKKLVSKLKKTKPKQLDAFVHQWHDELFNEVNCLDCANCCSSISPILTHKDIDRLSAALKMRPVKFITRYAKKDKENDFVFKQQPCPFLMTDNYCMVYPHRPKACKEYPHTNRKRFFQILKLSKKNAAVCPVVYQIFEYLSQQYLSA